MLFYESVILYADNVTIAIGQCMYCDIVCYRVPYKLTYYIYTVVINCLTFKSLVGALVSLV